jgi:phenylacetate-coenzyme A ligase PaaK-like adenylate-forming protein
MLEEQIFNINSKEQFEEVALEVFRYQFEHVKTYREFCEHLGITAADVNKVDAIPFLPIEFFKQSRIISSEKNAETSFLSSGTTGSRRSKHLVADLALYRRSFLEGFRLAYGEPRELVILALLPSYLEH